MSLNPDRGTLAGLVFSSSRRLVQFSHPNMPFFPDSEFVNFIYNIVIVWKH